MNFRLLVLALTPWPIWAVAGTCGKLLPFGMGATITAAFSLWIFYYLARWAIR